MKERRNGKEIETSRKGEKEEKKREKSNDDKYWVYNFASAVFQ